TLAVVASLLPQERHMGSRFHTLGDDLKPERARHRDGGAHNGSVPRVAVDSLDEGLVNLQAINREIFEVGQRTVAGAKIVDRQPNPKATQLSQRMQYLVAVG